MVGINIDKFDLVNILENVSFFWEGMQRLKKFDHILGTKANLSTCQWTNNIEHILLWQCKKKKEKERKKKKEGSKAKYT